MDIFNATKEEEYINNVAFYFKRRTGICAKFTINYCAKNERRIKHWYVKGLLAKEAAEKLTHRVNITGLTIGEACNDEVY